MNNAVSEREIWKKYIGSFRIEQGEGKGRGIKGYWNIKKITLLM